MKLYYISIDSPQYFFIDGTDEAEEGTWVYNLNGESAYLLWAPSEPNGGNITNCLLLLTASDGFDDGQCNREGKAICEYECEIIFLQTKAALCWKILLCQLCYDLDILCFSLQSSFQRRAFVF